MPHVIEHVEEDSGFIPLGFSPSTPDDGFIPLGFSGGPPEQRYVPENNSIVTVPAGATRSLASRESKELIDSETGLHGNTPTRGGIFDLGTEGIFEPSDFKILIGGVTQDAETLVSGLLRENVILAGERGVIPEGFVMPGVLYNEYAEAIARGILRKGLVN